MAINGITSILSYINPVNLSLFVQWLETKRKRKLEAHEVFSEDPALYRWQCWASRHRDPNSKDPTFVEDPRFRTSDGKVSRNAGVPPERRSGRTWSSAIAPLILVQVRFPLDNSLNLASSYIALLTKKYIMRSWADFYPLGCKMF